MGTINKRLAYQQLLESEGWKYFEEEIKARMEYIANQLIHGHFDFIDEVYSLQNEYRILKEVLAIPVNGAFYE